MGCIFSKKISNKIKTNQETKIENNTDKYILEKKNIDNTEQFSLVGSSCYVRVIDVYDGDTITVIFRFGDKFYNKKCRIYGIDTPEIRTKNTEEKKAGYEAKEFLKNLILGKVIWAGFEKEDKYGRLLATLWLDKESNESIDRIMIRSGHGYTYDGGKKKEFVTNILNYH